MFSTARTSTTNRRAGRLTAGLALSTALIFPAVAATTAAPAIAHTTQSQDGQAQDSRPFGERVAEEAARHAGKPYHYGATGPDSFDCSGYLLHVFGNLGREIPRTSADQYAASQKIAKQDMQLGDLIAMQNSSGRVTHVGIFAGDNSWWVASTSQDSIVKQTLYSENYSVGRFS